jgi:hypothetical protein
MGMIEIDGDLFDEETGEYAGSANPGWLPSVLETEEDLLNYLHLLLDAETRLASEVAKYNTVLQNVEKMVKRHKSKVKYMRDMYERQAGKVTESLLPRDKDGNFKTKTMRCPWGTVSLRDTKPTVKVQDMKMAVQFAKMECPSGIKVEEKVLVSAIPDVIKERLVSDPSLAESMGFSVSEGGQSVTVKTLVEAKSED